MTAVGSLAIGASYDSAYGTAGYILLPTVPNGTLLVVGAATYQRGTATFVTPPGWTKVEEVISADEAGSGPMIAVFACLKTDFVNEMGLNTVGETYEMALICQGYSGQNVTESRSSAQINGPFTYAAPPIFSSAVPRDAVFFYCVNQSSPNWYSVKGSSTYSGISIAMNESSSQNTIFNAAYNYADQGNDKQTCKSALSISGVAAPPVDPPSGTDLVVQGGIFVPVTKRSVVSGAWQDITSTTF